MTRVLALSGYRSAEAIARGARRNAFSMRVVAQTLNPADARFLEGLTIDGMLADGAQLHNEQTVGGCGLRTGRATTSGLFVVPRAWTSRPKRIDPLDAQLDAIVAQRRAREARP